MHTTKLARVSLGFIVALFLAGCGGSNSAAGNPSGATDSAPITLPAGVATSLAWAMTLPAAGMTSRASASGPSTAVPWAGATEIATGSAGTPVSGVPSQSADGQTPAWGVRTKTTGCVARGALPDPSCTPGDIFPSATVAQICVPGYSSRVRNVSAALKAEVFDEYGWSHHAYGVVEIDHLVALEDGGSNDISNLWPEPASPKPGFHEKDQVELWVRGQICRHLMSLADAQRILATNWVSLLPQAQAAGTPGGDWASEIDTGGAAAPTAPAPSSASTTAVSSSSALTLLSVSSPVSTGATASLKIQTSPGTSCSLRYTTPAGTVSQARGLGQVTADAGGVCSWTWQIGTSTRPGTGTLTVTAGGQTAAWPIVIQ